MNPILTAAAPMLSVTPVLAERAAFPCYEGSGIAARPVRGESA